MEYICLSTVSVMEFYRRFCGVLGLDVSSPCLSTNRPQPFPSLWKLLWPYACVPSAAPPPKSFHLRPLRKLLPRPIDLVPLFYHELKPSETDFLKRPLTHHGV